MTLAGSDDYAAIAEFYDFVVPYQTRQDVDFFVDAAVASGGPVLEVGCGTGRVLIPTARAGVAITGLDVSARMLEVCHERIHREPESVRLRIRLFRDDMRGFDLDQTFVLVTLPFRPFQHLLTVDDQVRCLTTIARHLRPGGRIILDLFNPWLEMLVTPAPGPENGDEPEFEMPDGRRILRRQRTVAADRAAQVNRFELIHYVTHPDGRTERVVQAFPFRYLFRFEAEHLLARTGFVVEHVYSTYDKRPYGATYPGEMILVARRS